MSREEQSGDTKPAKQYNSITHITASKQPSFPFSLFSFQQLISEKITYHPVQHLLSMHLNTVFFPESIFSTPLGFQEDQDGAI
mmetsp:Transcript_26410/g.67391  ORF Transcript_26410/g.67391 Transcript_26410/m.67391 type:complete len:83 (-) Transcript_26410:777-1025(-)